MDKFWYCAKYAFWAIFNNGESGLWSGICGRFRVRYSDTEVSQNMYYNFACSYADTFNGTVEYVGPKYK